MTNQSSPRKIYNIPAGVSFTDVLANGLLSHYDQQELANVLILLPTRRSCRSLREGFLRQSKGQPILLPKMSSFSDIDAEELQIMGLNHKNSEQLSIPPALSPLKRQILLSKLISQLPDISKNIAQDMALAQALGQLMDEIYTENLKLDDLPHIVDRDLFAEHWQITIDFLKLLSEHWPNILQAHGQIDAADRRNRLILALSDQWSNNPPNTPIIAAGSTGSIPATAQLLKTVSHLPKGEIILPGLDQNLSNDAWDDIEEGHPQATIKNIISHLEIERQDIKTWPQAEINNEKNIREKIFSYVMTPAEKTDEWSHLKISSDQKEQIEENLKQITRYDCDTSQEEAQIISVLLREILEDPDRQKTAALITPDRNLAQRVTSICHRWGIEIDDSAGQSLWQSNIGQYINLSAQMMIDDVKPLSLLAFLKHPSNTGVNYPDYRTQVRRLEVELLRGPHYKSGFDYLIEKHQQISKNDKAYQPASLETFEFIQHLQSVMSDKISLFSSQTHSFKTLLTAHIEIMENFSLQPDKSASDILWYGEEGEAAANILSEIFEYADYFPPLTGYDYLEIIKQIISNVTTRPAYGTHPRLMILGQLEARLIQADRVILSGLNEGTWPPDAGHDPWMSRPMRQKFGLPPPERGTTLAAHDFVQGACSQEVFITRSKRVGDSPSVPSRWLQRLDTFLTAIDIAPDTICRGPHKAYAEILDQVDDVTPIDRPKPCPPLSARPATLSVTQIDTWLKDPYGIYASDILKLRKLDPIDKKFDAAERGTILHSIMEEFTKEFATHIPANAAEKFIQIAWNIFAKNQYDSSITSFWIPRLHKLADWVTSHETEWRTKASFGVNEAKGFLEISEGIDTPFTIRGRADRIDKMYHGGAAIIDYKSGGTYSIKKMQSAELNQLPLEALILEGGGFKQSGIDKMDVYSLSYWVLTGGSDVGKVTELSGGDKINDTIITAQTGLINLIKTYQNIDTTYIAIPDLDRAPPYNNYEHFERVKEWAALGDENEEIAGASF